MESSVSCVLWPGLNDGVGGSARAPDPSRSTKGMSTIVHPKKGKWHPHAKTTAQTMFCSVCWCLLYFGRESDRFGCTQSESLFNGMFMNRCWKLEQHIYSYFPRLLWIYTARDARKHHYDHVRPSSKIFKVQSEPSQLDLETLGATRLGHQGDRGVGPRLGARGWFRDHWASTEHPEPKGKKKIVRKRRRLRSLRSRSSCQMLGDCDFLIFLEVWVLNGSIVKEKRRDGPNHDVCKEPWYPWCVHRWCSQRSRKGSNHAQETATT